VVATLQPALDPIATASRHAHRPHHAGGGAAAHAAAGRRRGLVRRAAALKFTDRDGQTSADGILKALVKERRTGTPGVVQFRLKGKAADFQVDTDNLELVVVVGGVPQGLIGQCGRVSFGPGGVGDPSCEFSSGNNVLRCD
jgi:hypothetical protein